MKRNIKLAFSIAEIVISMAIIAVVLIATFYNILRRQHRDVANALHGEIACYYNDAGNFTSEGHFLLASGAIKNIGPTHGGSCVFDNLPTKADFEVIVIGGGGGGGDAAEPQLYGETTFLDEHNKIKTYEINISPDMSYNTAPPIKRVGAWVLPDHTTTGTIDTQVKNVRENVYNGLSSIIPNENVFSGLFLTNVEIEALGASGEGALKIDNSKFPEGYLAVAPGGPGGRVVWRGNLGLDDTITGRFYREANGEMVSNVEITRGDSDIADFSAVQGPSPYLRPKSGWRTNACPYIVDYFSTKQKTGWVEQETYCKFTKKDKYNGRWWNGYKVAKSEYDGLNCGYDLNDRSCMGTGTKRDDFCCKVIAGSQVCPTADFNISTTCSREVTDESVCKKYYTVGKNKGKCKKYGKKTEYYDCYVGVTLDALKKENCKHLIGCTIRGVNCSADFHYKDNKSDYANYEVGHDCSGSSDTNCYSSRGLRSEDTANRVIDDWVYNSEKAKLYGAQIRSNNNMTANFASRKYSYEYKGADGEPGQVLQTKVKSFQNNRIEICSSGNTGCANGFVGSGGEGGQNGASGSDGNTTCFGTMNGSCTTSAIGGRGGLSSSQTSLANVYQFKYSARGNNGQPVLCQSHPDNVNCQAYSGTGTQSVIDGHSDACTKNENGSIIDCNPNTGSVSYIQANNKYKPEGYPVGYAGYGGLSWINWNGDNLYVTATLLKSSSVNTETKYITNVPKTNYSTRPNPNITTHHTSGARGGGGAIIIRW